MIWDLSQTFKSNLVYAIPQIGAPTGPENPEFMTTEVFGLYYNEIEKLWVQNEAESFYAAFCYISNKFSINMAQKY